MLSPRPMGSVCGSLHEEETSRVSSREEGRQQTPLYVRERDSLLNVENTADVTAWEANMYPGVESIHKKILSQSLEWNENVNYDRDFIQCFRNLRPQGLWHAISSRSGDAGFLLAFRYFLSTHSTPLKIYETLKAAGLCWIGTFKVIFQHDSSSLSFFVLWLSIFFLIYCLTLSSLVLVPILSATID